MPVTTRAAPRGRRASCNSSGASHALPPARGGHQDETPLAYKVVVVEDVVVVVVTSQPQTTALSLPHSFMMNVPLMCPPRPTRKSALGPVMKASTSAPRPTRTSGPATLITGA